MAIPPLTSWTTVLSPQHSVHAVPLPLLESLAAGDLESASSLVPDSLPPLTPFSISEGSRNLWRRRLAQVAADPEQAPWVSRLIIYEDPGTSSAAIVGRIGFHGKPDERGMVELGYEIDPEHRRKGHASAAVRIMIHVARATASVNVLRASVAEENLLSARVALGQGLRKVGTRVHEQRGLEGIYEIDVSK